MAGKTEMAAVITEMETAPVRTAATITGTETTVKKAAIRDRETA